MTNTEERVCRLVAHDLGIIQEQLRPSSLLALELRVDSLDRVTIAMSMEEAFGIEVDDSRVEAAATVAGLVSIVDTALGGRIIVREGARA